jgi:glycerophosphoryl diester phosphodiesterase
MADGLALRLPGHTIRLKWHRLRRELGDPVFTLRRLEEGLALGASLEIDLRLHAGGGFVVLHDDTLERETTGSGKVADATAAELKSLRIRWRDGQPTGSPLLLLEDIAPLIRRHPSTQALLQLDLKEEISRLSDGVVGSFTDGLAGLGPHLTVSGEDWAAVKRLAEGVRGMGTGYDPCELAEARRLETRADVTRLVDVTGRIAPEADTIYLDYRLILAAERLGHDVVAAFHSRGQKIDAWTLNTDQPDATRFLQRLVDLRVDQITTDEPIKLEAMWAAIALERR